MSTEPECPFYYTTLKLATIDGYSVWVAPPGKDGKPDPAWVGFYGIRTARGEHFTINVGSPHRSDVTRFSRSVADFIQAHHQLTS